MHARHSVSSSWTAELAQQAFDGEYAACCFEAELCGNFLSSLGSPADPHATTTRTSPWPVPAINDAQSTLYSTHATLTAKVTADAAGAVQP